MMLRVVCLLSICLFCLHTAEFSQRSTNTTRRNNTAAAAGTRLTDGNVTFKEMVSGLSGFSDVAGLRSFTPEQEMETRIIGGQEAWAHSWPWQVSVCFTSMPACGGAIIAPQWIITAAHCFKRFNRASYWKVVAGKHDLDNPEEPGQQSVAVSVIIRHSGYNTRTKENDVALLKLQRPLVFTHFIRPIHIWMKPLPVLRVCTVTGWGSTTENGPRVHRLQEVNVTILPPDVCNQYYMGRVMSSMFCAGKEIGGVDACQGDSGGPMSCFTGSRFELAGVVSWGVGCGRARKPGVYTKVQQHSDWLQSHMNELMYDDVTDEEEQCGTQQSSSCHRPPGFAALSWSQGSEATVENVTESCPFFWPWQVSLQSNGRHYCSGVLIHRRWVITAKHCNVRAKEDVAVLGIHDLRFLSPQAVPVDRVVNPPQDDSYPPRSDLSLLHLSSSARFSSNVFPVCVPEEDEELNDSWSCFTAGWGATKATGHISPDRLHHAGLTLVNRTTCRDHWGGLITDSHVCAHPAGSASCMGDAGAPLYCRKHGAYFLFGLVTWGSRRCDVNKPSVFTGTSDYHSWVTEVTEDF